MSAASLAQLAGKIANAALAPLGVEMARRGRGSSAASLARMRQLGVSPATAIDVGAAYGEWSALCRRTFPAIGVIAVDPLPEFTSVLRERVELEGATVIEAAAASEAGRATLNVHADLVGTSLLREAAGGGVDGVPREVRTVTVDDLVAEHGAQPPFLLKIDVQGAEAEVVEGAERALRETAAVILEVSFLPFFLRGLELHDVVALMREHGFAVWDVVDLLHRPLDGALAQANAVFVPLDSPLRRDVRFATTEQRRALDAAFSRTYRWRRYQFLRRSRRRSDS